MCLLHASFIIAFITWESHNSYETGSKRFTDTIVLLWYLHISGGNQIHGDVVGGAGITSTLVKTKSYYIFFHFTLMKFSLKRFSLHFKGQFQEHCSMLLTWLQLGMYKLDIWWNTLYFSKIVKWNVIIVPRIQN